LTAVAAYSGPRSIGDVLKNLSIGFLLFSMVRSGLCSFAFGVSLTLTSSTKTMFLTKIEPYLVLLIHIVFYGQRVTVAHLVLLAAHLAGAVVLSTGGEFALSPDIAGDLLLFAAVGCNAAFYGPAQRYARELGALYTSGLSQIIGGVCLLPFMIGFSSAMFDLSGEKLVGWYFALGTVLIFYVLSTALWFFSLKQVPAWLASALRCVGPVFAAPLAWMLFDARLTAIQLAGAFVVVATSVWMLMLERRS